MKNMQASLRDFLHTVHFTVDLIILKKEIKQHSDICKA